jgi:carboxylesterase type B
MPQTTPTTKVVHSLLGEIVGVHRGDVVRFSGIPYASIPSRFRQSVMNTALPSRPFDATSNG